MAPLAVKAPPTLMPAPLVVARVDALLEVMNPEAGVLPAPAVPPKVLSKVIEPFRLIAPFAVIDPPADIALRLTPEPPPAELSVMAMRVIFCLEPLVLLRVSVGVKPAAVMLKVSAVVWVIVPEAMMVTLVPAFMAV